MNAVSLEVKAFVKVPICLSPRYIYLQGDKDKRVTRVVEIRAGLDKPLTLTPTKFNLEGKLTYRLEEIEKGRIYQIRFTSVPGPPQTYRGFLVLNTNYSEKPEIKIRIRGRFLETEKN